MEKTNLTRKSKLSVNNSYEGEYIETKIERIVHNNEPITDGAPLIYTDRKDGVLPEYDIRTDRFEIAIDAMKKVAKTNIAKRQQYIEDRNKETKKETKKDVGNEPIQATK